MIPALHSGPSWISSLWLAKPSRNMTSVTGTVVVLTAEVEVVVDILHQQILTGYLECARPSSSLSVQQ